MKKSRVGIVNVTGYTGIELARLLIQHPGVALTSVTGRSNAGKRLDAVFPHLIGTDLVIEAELGQVELAFSAMPHRESAPEVRRLLARGIRVVDLSADFRLRDAAQYAAWYGFNHPEPQLLEQAAYGLTELHRDEITSARLVANPGCYPTGALLALAPAVKQGLINGHFIIDSKSGISGAGRSLDLMTHYAEANEDVTAYALDGHRHLPEIVQELEQLRPQPSPSVTFVPHLVPMTRGLLTTCYTPLRDELATSPRGKEELEQIYLDFYQDEPFVKVVTTPPHSKHTLGSNMCLIHPTIDTRTGRLVVVSCLDNLVKGAAGQAIQNMNLMLGLPETSGLEARAVWP
ncbi:MAG: N-acetyl-gamma-glutamyl-phosphate reductase [Dehalococcoidales bacterium]|nr:N-acetyl-gamma-glutamyl-phosphate reductase [Dehalococcoidales bacterium]